MHTGLLRARFIRSDNVSKRNVLAYLRVVIQIAKVNIA